MNCQHCNTENGNDARFWKVCGNTLYVNNQVTSNLQNKSRNVNVSSNELSGSSDIMILIYIGFYGFTTFLMFILQATHMMNKYVSVTLNIFHILSIILIPLAIKKASFKVIAIVIAVLIMIYLIYRNISFLF